MVSNPVYTPDGRRYSSRQCPPYFTYSHHPHHPGNSNSSSSSYRGLTSTSPLHSTGSTSPVHHRTSAHGQEPPHHPHYSQARRASSVSTSSSVGYLTPHHARALTSMTDTVDSDAPQRKRIAVACGRCRKRKIRCSGDPGGGAPCSNCKNAGYEPCLFLRVASAEAAMRGQDVGQDFEYNPSFARAYAGRSAMPSGPGSHHAAASGLGFTDVSGLPTSGPELMYSARSGYPYTAGGASASRYYSAIPGYSTYSGPGTSAQQDYDAYAMAAPPGRGWASRYYDVPEPSSVYGYAQPSTANITLAHRPAPTPTTASPHQTTSPAESAPFSFSHVADSLPPQHNRMLPHPSRAMSSSSASSSNGGVRSPTTPSSTSTLSDAARGYEGSYSSAGASYGGDSQGFGMSAEAREALMSNGGAGELRTYAYGGPGGDTEDGGNHIPTYGSSTGGVYTTGRRPADPIGSGYGQEYAHRMSAHRTR